MLIYKYNTTFTLHKGAIGMKIGYARISTPDQDSSLQQDALKKAECEKVYIDIASGAKDNRPELLKALEQLRKGDTLVVWRLDRLGRSLKHLLKTVEELENDGVGFISLTEGFDTTTNGGKLVFHIFGALGEFERNLIVERTNAGLAAARARGRKGGRKEKLTAKQIKTLKSMYDSGKHSVAEIGQTFSISRPTVYSYMKKA